MNSNIDANSKNTKRIRWVDTAKGLGIVMVCLGHCIQNMEVPLNRIILSFHMPLFFFLSGVTIKKITINRESFMNLIKKKIVVILIPMLSFGLLNFGVHYIIDRLIVTGKATSIFDITYYCNSWFLEALFFSVIIGTIIVSYRDGRFELLVTIMLICVFLFAKEEIYFIGRLQQIVVALIFSMSGHMIYVYGPNSKRCIDKMRGGYWITWDRNSVTSFIVYIM